jgi:DNA polymerase V
MDTDSFFTARYKGSKQFTQWDVTTANATGFTAAADDHMERGIDLNEQLIHNKAATFFFRMNCDDMIGAGIFPGDTLIVDRSIKPANGKIIIAIIDGELIVRRLQINLNATTLVAENKRYTNITLSAFNEKTMVWGVVTHAIHSFNP